VDQDEWARVQIRALEQRLADLEKQVFGEVKAPPGPEADAEFQSYIASGDKLRAIKRYIALTGSDLSAGKDAVERIMAGG
jgi:ribosomal protein L7/L12